MADQYFNFAVHTDAIIQQVLNQTNIQVSEAFKRFSQNWRQSATRRAGMAEVNERIGREAQREMVAAYQKKVGKRPSYRQGDRGKWRRYSGEKMRNALQAKEFMSSDYNGIYFGDVEFLDEKAPQWYRLNFGAHGTDWSRAGKSPAQGSMKFFNRAIPLRIDLSDYPPSDAFFIPKGAFFSSDFQRTSTGGKLRGVKPSKSARGADALYVMRRGVGLKRVTKSTPMSIFGGRREAGGIKGARFFEVGARHINENYGPAVTKLARDWFKEAISKMK